jgi:hypothetical protein
LPPPFHAGHHRDKQLQSALSIPRFQP